MEINYNIFKDIRLFTSIKAAIFCLYSGPAEPGYALPFQTV